MNSKKKLRVTIKSLLSILENDTSWMFIPSKSETLRRLKNLPYKSFEEEFWREYHLSSVKSGIEALKRLGKVEIHDNENGTEVRITNKGKTEALKYKLNEMKLDSHAKWDGKWRLIFFDIQELNKSKRDMFRRYLLKLGLKPYQKSVFITPHDCKKQILFLREVSGVPDGVKIAIADEIENEEEFKEVFDL